ncbi:imelysin family protein [Sulfitobacter sp. LCG007]
MRCLAALPLALLLAAPAWCGNATVETVVAKHILPGFGRLAADAKVLEERARQDCAPESPGLREAYNDAFDAWIRVSHLRFGPTEVGDRAFALAFWPDVRGFTPRTLGTLIAEEDPAVATQEAFAHVSVAGRGFYALEYLLYDDSLSVAGDPAYHCALVEAVARDISATSEAILSDWQERYAALLTTAGAPGNTVYRSEDEALQELYKAIATGLQFTQDTRIGRPLGTFEKSYPSRAEARRSGRSLRHVVLSLEATHELAGLLSEGEPAAWPPLDRAFDNARDKALTLDDPVFAGVAEPQSRLRVEVLYQAFDEIRERYLPELGAALGVAPGFNALDGD